MTPGPANANSPSKPDERDRPSGEPAGQDLPDTESTVAPEDATVRDWIEADASRPDLPEETADGLDDTDEEVRRQGEDLPPDTPGRLR